MLEIIQEVKTRTEIEVYRIIAHAVKDKKAKS